MKRSIRADEYTCDACGQVELVVKGNEVDGFYGKARKVSGETHTPLVDWFACSPSCITDAVSNAIERPPETEPVED